MILPPWARALIAAAPAGHAQSGLSARVSSKFVIYPSHLEYHAEISLVLPCATDTQNYVVVHTAM